MLPGSAWPVQPPLEAVWWAALTAFPGARIGGGARCFFTEMNRRRPLTHFLDYISFTTTPIVHAADDRSVMETLETMPAIFASAAAIADGKPWRVGPIRIGARDNPYGAGPSPNPDNVRVCLADADPRQRGLFGAAWTVGYLAPPLRAAPRRSSRRRDGSARRDPPPPPQGFPWFDDCEGRRMYPVFHVVSAAAAGSGSDLLATRSSAPGRIAALGWLEGKIRPTVVANLTAERQRAELTGASLGRATFARWMRTRSPQRPPAPNG